jgi:hypothetical protein
MRVRRRRALVRGRPASHWFYTQDCIVLRKPGGVEETDVPVAHLIDDALVEEHRRRLSAKTWVSPEALAEFDEIVAGART